MWTHFPTYEIHVGDKWVPADGSNRVHEITFVNEDYVWHKNIDTGEEFRKSAFGFQCRYCKVVE